MTSATEKMPSITGAGLDSFLPGELRNLGDLQTELPRIAKDAHLTGLIDSVVTHIPTAHHLHRGDVRRQAARLRPESVHLVLTSPPYWTLKEYHRSPGQLGFIEGYDEFLTELDKAWRCCFRALVPGGRLIIVVGDVCLS